MASKIKLNNNQGDTITLEHSDTISSLGSRVIPLDNITHKVSTIAELGAMTERPEFVYVEAYDDSGSTYGAFGSYFFKRSLVVEADNGGTVIQSVNDTYELQYSGEVNVKWFGADNSGATNASIAIQNAINAAEASGASVLIPRGLYKISANMTLKTGVSIYGQGKSTILLMDGNNRKCFAASAVEDVIISSLYINGQKPNVGWQTTDNYDMGIQLGGSATSQSVKNITIQNCTFKDIGLDGIYAENYNNVLVDNCDFINCRRWGIVPQGGTYNGENFTITDSYFDCDYNTGPVGKEYPLGAVDSEPDTGTVTNLRYSGLTGKHNTTAVLASNNSIINASIENCVIDDHLSLSNTIVDVKNVTITGPSAYFIADSVVDSVPTRTNSIDIKFSETGRTQTVVSTGSDNLLPSDYPRTAFFNTVPSYGGTGGVAETLCKLENKDVYLEKLSLGTGTGTALAFKETLGVNIVENDQVIIYAELERLDSNEASPGNFLNITLGTTVRDMQVAKGKHKIVIAYKASANETTPSFQAGLNGTVTADVEVIFTKLQIIINPSYFNTDTIFSNASAVYAKIEGGVSKAGIGTINPNSALEIYNTDGSSNTQLHIHNDSTSGAAVLKLEGGRTSNNDACQINFANAGNLGSSIKNYRSGGDDGGEMRFYTSPSGSGDILTEQMRLDSSGNLLVGRTSAGNTGAGHSIRGGDSFIISRDASGETLQVCRNASDGQYIRFYQNGVLRGNIAQSGATTQYNASSDYRLKDDYQSITNSIEVLKSLNPINFKWIEDGKRSDGFLAHELQEVIPEAVYGTKDGMMDETYIIEDATVDNQGNIVKEAVYGVREVPDYQGIDQSKLVPLLTKALQEAIQRIEALEAS